MAILNPLFKLLGLSHTTAKTNVEIPVVKETPPPQRVLVVEHSALMDYELLCELLRQQESRAGPTQVAESEIYMGMHQTYDITRMVRDSCNEFCAAQFAPPGRTIRKDGTNRPSSESWRGTRRVRVPKSTRK